MPSFVAGNSQWHWQPNLPISVIDRPYSNAGLPYLEWQINENETLYATTMSELDHFSRRCTACLKALGQITTVKGSNNPEPSEVNCSVGSELEWCWGCLVRDIRTNDLYTSPADVIMLQTFGQYAECMKQNHLGPLVDTQSRPTATSEQYNDWYTGAVGTAVSIWLCKVVPSRVSTHPVLWTKCNRLPIKVAAPLSPNWKLLTETEALYWKHLWDHTRGTYW